MKFWGVGREDGFNGLSRQSDWSRRIGGRSIFYHLSAGRRQYARLILTRKSRSCSREEQNCQELSWKKHGGMRHVVSFEHATHAYQGGKKEVYRTLHLSQYRESRSPVILPKRTKACAVRKTSWWLAELGRNHTPHASYQPSPPLLHPHCQSTRTVSVSFRLAIDAEEIVIVPPAMSAPVSSIPLAAEG